MPDEPDPVVEVVVSDEQQDIRIDADRWARLAHEVLVDEGRHGELTLTFVDRAEIAELNSDYMGATGPTDVLSFPLDADVQSSDMTVPGTPVLLGDIVICPAVADDAAPAHAGSLDDELALLVVHGVLHVLGHDHTGPADTERMQARELHHLESWHWHGSAPAGFSLTHAEHGGPDH